MLLTTSENFVESSERSQQEQFSSISYNEYIGQLLQHSIQSLFLSDLSLKIKEITISEVKAYIQILFLNPERYEQSIVHVYEYFMEIWYKFILIAVSDHAIVLESKNYIQVNYIICLLQNLVNQCNPVFQFWVAAMLEELKEEKSNTISQVEYMFYIRCIRSKYISADDAIGLLETNNQVRYTHYMQLQTLMVQFRYIQARGHYQR